MLSDMCLTRLSCPPQKLIFTCRAVYALLLQVLLDGAGFYIIYTCYPMYMKTVLNYNITQVNKDHVALFCMNPLNHGRVVQCCTCDREVMGSSFTRGCCVPMPTQHAIPTGSVNEQ